MPLAPVLFQDDFAPDVAPSSGGRIPPYVTLAVPSSQFSPADLVWRRDRAQTGVRAKLGIQHYPTRAAVDFEQSMGKSLTPCVLHASTSRMAENQP